MTLLTQLFDEDGNVNNEVKARLEEVFDRLETVSKAACHNWAEIVEQSIAAANAKKPSSSGKINIPFGGKQSNRDDQGRQQDKDEGNKKETTLNLKDMKISLEDDVEIEIADSDNSESMSIDAEREQVTEDISKMPPPEKEKSGGGHH